MTQAKAATVASALTTAGYYPQVALAAGQYIVIVNSPGTDVATINTFATNNAVAGKVDGAVIFS